MKCLNKFPSDPCKKEKVDVKMIKDLDSLHSTINGCIKNYSKFQVILQHSSSPYDLS